MAKRVKPDKPVLLPVPNWEHADDFVRRISDLAKKITDAEQAAKDKINEVKADMADELKPLQEKIQLYTRSLEAFGAIHKADFGKKRSRKLNFGILGWRKSTSVSVTKKTLGLIKEVFSRAKAKQFIHTKETVDKEALAKLTDEQLAEVSARRKVKDDFFVEPAVPEVVDYVR